MMMMGEERTQLASWRRMMRLFCFSNFFLHCAISIREIDLMMGRETTGKGHSWMGGHCKYDGWMTGERHVFSADATATFCFCFCF